MEPSPMRKRVKEQKSLTGAKGWHRSPRRTQHLHTPNPALSSWSLRAHFLRRLTSVSGSFLRCSPCSSSSIKGMDTVKKYILMGEWQTWARDSSLTESLSSSIVSDVRLFVWTCLFTSNRVVFVPYGWSSKSQNLGVRSRRSFPV